MSYKDRTIKGTFLKQSLDKQQKYIHAAQVENPVEVFDATATILFAPLSFIQSIEDDSELTDGIGRTFVDWDGPCEVSIEEEVLNFFRVGDLDDITQEMLDEARSEMVTTSIADPVFQNPHLSDDYNIIVEMTSEFDDGDLVIETRAVLDLKTGEFESLDVVDIDDYLDEHEDQPNACTEEFLMVGDRKINFEQGDSFIDYDVLYELQQQVRTRKIQSDEIVSDKVILTFEKDGKVDFNLDNSISDELSDMISSWGNKMIEPGVVDPRDPRFINSITMVIEELGDKKSQVMGN